MPIARYHSLDKLKVLCAFLIVCVHAPFPGVIGEYFMPLTRIAVPIFFMVSGFFWNPDSLRKQITKLLKLLIFANVLYFFVDLAKAFARHGVSDFFSDAFSLESLFQFVVFNESPFAPHLWYLGAIIYVLIVSYYVEKFKLKQILVYVIPILLLVDLVLGKYSRLIFNREFPYIFVRNWLFVGVPYFFIGNFIHEDSHGEKKRFDFSCIAISCGVLLFSVTSLLERYLLVLNELDTRRDHYISTTFLAIAVFTLFLLYIDNNASFISRVGRQDTTLIYIIHYLIIGIMGGVVKAIGVRGLYKPIRPVVVFILTTVLVEGFNFVKVKTGSMINKEKRCTNS